MDSYTAETKIWLDNRFQKCTEDGVYFAHQPIYGFRGGCSEPGLLFRYIITYQTLKTLSHLKFDSFLDVGGAEGYKSALVKKLFGVHVKNSDLSAQACERAKEIFAVPSDPVDIHDLPYSDNQFDVVLCSESLEHVTDDKKAVGELLRVAKKAVIITVPHESHEHVQKNREGGEAHAHIHAFELGSFDFLGGQGYRVLAKKAFSFFSKPLFLMIDAQKRDYKENSYSSFLFKVHNFLVPFYRKIFGANAASWILKADEWLSGSSRNFTNIIYLILKDRDAYTEVPLKKITPKQIINFSVPLHYVNGSK